MSEQGVHPEPVTDEEPLCRVHERGMAVETGPGIFVTRRGRDCGEPAAWELTWTEEQLVDGRLDATGVVQADRRSYVCESHEQLLRASPGLFVGARGDKPQTVHWRRL